MPQPINSEAVTNVTTEIIRAAEYRTRLTSLMIGKPFLKFTGWK